MKYKKNFLTKSSIKYKTKLFSKISSDIYQNITLPEVKDCLTFEDMRHSPRFMSKNVGSMTDFIRDMTSKEGERPQDKIFQYVTFFSLWEMAANIESESKIKEENRRKTIIKKFFNAVRTDEWKNKQTLISRYKNQVNLYLYYIAECLISYHTSEDKIVL